MFVVSFSTGRSSSCPVSVRSESYELPTRNGLPASEPMIGCMPWLEYAIKAGIKHAGGDAVPKLVLCQKQGGARGRGPVNAGAGGVPETGELLWASESPACQGSTVVPTSS